MITDSIKKDILKEIAQKKPYKVLLFGSYAYGNAGQESDLDLLVVLDKEGLPRDYKERSANYLEISQALRSLNKKIPLDILVMTRTQWAEFIKENSGFAKEIMERGIKLL